MTLIKTNNVFHALHEARAEFLRAGRTVDRQEWQAKRDNRPQTRVFEVHDVSFRVVINHSVEWWQKECKPNLPWAEDHFQERISGEPLNPGEEYKNWPWYEQGVEEHKETGEFSHTYMERFWPKRAGRSGNQPSNVGIRHFYGDLQNLTTLLIQRPYTRQAYLPIWFPEDLSAACLQERVPCTLGYHFIAYPGATNEDKPSLRVTYFMRSCDWFRYLRDDLYMAGRLLQHVARSTEMEPTLVTMHIANLHVFNLEVPRLRREHEEAEKERLANAF